MIDNLPEEVDHLESYRHMGCLEACRHPWSIVVEGEQDDKEFQQVQSCFAIVPKKGGHASYRWGSLAFD